MESWLNITEEQFMSLPVRKQMGVLFQNQVKTMSLIKGYRWNQKVQYISITVLTAGVLFLLKYQIPILFAFSGVIGCLA